jgi:hypothetical protein
MRLLALREELGDVVRTAYPRARLAVEIADDLIAYPILSISDAVRRYGRVMGSRSRSATQVALRAVSRAAESATAPKTPPCMVTMWRAARWLAWSVAPEQSDRSRHS